MSGKQKLVIFGATAFAQIAFEYFTQDSPYEVVAFSVDRDYLHEPELCGLPVVPFEELTDRYPPEGHAFFAAITYQKLNRLRAEKAHLAKLLGYRLATYASSRAFVWRNVTVGEHCFIFENNVVQPFVRLGNNVVLWSGNHIGHHSVIGDNVFVSSHVVVSGYAVVGTNCFLGVNSTIANNVDIGDDCWLGPGTIANKGVPRGTLLQAPKSESAKVTTYQFFKVPSPSDGS